MTRATTRSSPVADLSRTDLDHAVQELTALGSSLARSYHALEERAQRVEVELARANRELARKVEQLDAVTAELEAVLDALPTGVVVRDVSGRIVRVNDAALSVLGRSREELVGTDAVTLTEAHGEQPSDGWRQHEFVRADGKRTVIARRCGAVGGEPMARGRARSLEILDDRTTLVELSERMHALDKLAALGDMAGGIAHELRNPMMAVKGFADLLAAKLDPRTDTRRWAELIVQGVDEANAILTSMMSLASPQKLVLETVDAQELARDTLSMAARDSGLDADSQGWRLESRAAELVFGGDRIKLRQALRNLVANAIQSQGSQGTVRVEIERQGDEVVLGVSDAGPGIPRALAARVLEPFFTTRAEGVGLGLALVERIAQLHGGRVHLVPQGGPLGGASIALRIPYRSTQS